MPIRFTNLNETTSRGTEQLANSFSALSASKATGTSDEVLVTQVVGFHLYIDLFLSEAITTSQTEETAKTLLAAIEEVADIANASARVADTFLFEVQGLRTHVFINAPILEETSFGRLLGFSSYLAKSIDKRVRKIVGEDYRKCCMAAAHGSAIVISTGKKADDSLISLGNPANRPAKRLSREDIGDGILAVPIEMVADARFVESELSEQSGNKWLHIDVAGKDLRRTLVESDRLMLEEIANAQRISDSDELVCLSAKSSEVVDTSNATVEKPRVIQAMVFRADLDGFTSKVEEASRRGEAALRLVVEELLAILDIPQAFEDYLERKVVRLPWAGDCYTACFLLDDDESVEELRREAVPTACLLWHDPDGAVNRTRDVHLRRIASRQKWSVGVAVGEAAHGKLLIANIHTSDRKFLVAAGWAVRHSLEAQNSKGLSENESAVHVADHEAMRPPYKPVFQAWENGRGYRKATAIALKEAADKEVQSLAPTKTAPSVASSGMIHVATRPFADTEK